MLPDSEWVLGTVMMAGQKQLLHDKIETKLICTESNTCLYQVCLLEKIHFTLTHV